MEIRYRHAVLDDIASLHGLIERAFRGEEARKCWTSEASLLSAPRTNPDELHAMILSNQLRFVLAHIDEKLVGCAFAERCGATGYFGMLSIDPTMQMMGIGSRLLVRVEEEVQSLWQCRALALRVISIRTDIIAWYERRGYALTGHQEDFPFELHPASGRSDFCVVEMKKIFA